MGSSTVGGDMTLENIVSKKITKVLEHILVLEYLSVWLAGMRDKERKLDRLPLKSAQVCSWEITPQKP